MNPQGYLDLWFLVFPGRIVMRPYKNVRGFAGDPHPLKVAVSCAIGCHGLPQNNTGQAYRAVGCHGPYRDTEISLQAKENDNINS